MYLGTHCVDFSSHWPPQPSSEAACEDGGGDAEPRVLHGHHGSYVVVVECSDQVDGLGQHKNNNNIYTIEISGYGIRK